MAAVARLMRDALECETCTDLCGVQVRARPRNMWATRRHRRACPPAPTRVPNACDVRDWLCASSLTVHRSPPAGRTARGQYLRVARQHLAALRGRLECAASPRPHV